MTRRCGKRSRFGDCYLPKGHREQGIHEVFIGPGLGFAFGPWVVPGYTKFGARPMEFLPGRGRRRGAA